MRRLSVNINDECARVLEKAKEQRGVSATETIRRALSMYEFMENEKLAGRKIMSVDGSTETELVWP